MSFDITKTPSLENTTPTHYSASIVEILNEKTVLVSDPFTNKNSDGENITLPIFGQAQISFETLPNLASYSDANLISYANMQLHDMRTFSGDVFKAKIYAKPEGGLDDYSLVAEVPIEGNELLVDTDSISTDERSGYFINQKDLHTYWSVSVV